MFDNLFLLAIAAFGWGLCLLTYRLFARKNKWPMGALQSDLPAVPILLGLFALVAAILFAAARGFEYGGWLILAWIFLSFAALKEHRQGLFLVPVAIALGALATSRLVKRGWAVPLLLLVGCLAFIHGIYRSRPPAPTGYAEASIERVDARGAEFELISKPYRRTELAAKVRQVIEGPTGVG